MVQLLFVKPPPKITVRRIWSGYSKEILDRELMRVDWSNEATTVQEAWDDFETKLIPIVDSIIPMSSFYNNVNSKRPSCSIQRKRTLRKRLLKTFKRNPTLDLKN